MPGTRADSLVTMATHCPTPMGVALFRHEPFATKIRSWVEASADVRHWREFDQGGHFAAMERPEELLEEIRFFFHDVLK